MKTGTLFRESPPEPINVPNRAQAAAQALRDAIMVGRLKPGDRIPEQHWASALGIGQPTIREALRELEYQGMVVKSPNKGTYVAQLGQDDYHHLIQVRMPLESLAIGLAARRITPVMIDDLQEHVNKMAKAAEARDLAAFHENDVAFHRKIWTLAENPYLLSCLEAVAFRLFVFSVLGDRSNLRAENRAAVEQHRRILEGLRAGDPEKAQQAFVESTRNYWGTHYDLVFDDLQLCFGLWSDTGPTHT